MLSVQPPLRIALRACGHAEFQREEGKGGGLEEARAAGLHGQRQLLSPRVSTKSYEVYGAWA